MPYPITPSQTLRTAGCARRLAQHLHRIASLAVLLCASLLGPARAALDADALTDDHSINTPTEWWTYANQSAQEVTERLQYHGARITGLEVQAVTGSGEPRFTVRLVANTGAYAVSGWSWHYNQSPAQITALINANTARLIDIERYDRGGGQIRYAVVLVPNSGAAARAWSYLLGVTKAQITEHIARSGHRPIDLDAYGLGSARRHNAIFVANAGADLKAYEWDVDRTVEEIVARTTAFHGRLSKLSRQPNGNYVYVQVRNTADNTSAWWHRYGFGSLTEVENYGHQMGARPLDVFSYPYGNGRRFDATFIDNANAEERRMRGLFARFVDPQTNPRGIFEAYLKAVEGPVQINLNGQRRAETASALKVLHLLHTMRKVQAGTDFLASNNFIYYDYYYTTDNAYKDRCPIAEQEIPSHQQPTITLETGLDWMMDDSDNRTTRGVVLRYGGFAPINATAAWARLSGTTLRHNIGCAYRDPNLNWTFSPATVRNDTTAADLASIYEGVWTGELLSATHRARGEFLESAFDNHGVSDDLRAVIIQEAVKLNKFAIAAEFANQVRQWGKGGSYGTCLGDPADRSQCGQGVAVFSNAGLIQLPVRIGTHMGVRLYAYGVLISDVPVPDWEDPVAVLDKAAYKRAHTELFRTAIHAALASW